MASQQGKPQLHKNNLTTLLYHDLFDYPLTKKELHKWHTNIKSRRSYRVENYKDFYYLAGKKKIVINRLQREKYAKRKLVIANKSARLLKYIPTIMFVGITGSLAMNNTKKVSDIDFLIITKEGNLWTTRLFTYLLLFILNINVRKAGEREERDKLCLNMWLDETDLKFKEKNIYTAHEIAQIKPLVNKNKIYERLIGENTWIFEYWPNAVGRIQENKKKGKRKKTSYTLYSNFLYLVEKWARGAQMFYMKEKKSREVVTETRAFFHPFDWGEKVVNELASRVGESKKNT